MIKLYCFFIISIILLIFFKPSFSQSNCSYNENLSISEQISYCYSQVSGLKQEENLNIESGGVSNFIQNLIVKISIYFGIFAVLAIVYSGFLMTFYGIDEEKLNKAKSIMKWSLLGLIGVMGSSFIIQLIIRLFYSIV